MKAKKRNFGWIQTINALDEKTFPLLIKNVSIKQLLVIFPLAIATIYVIKYNVLYAFVTLAPIMFIISYEEKSLGPFEYIIYFFLSILFTSPPSRQQKTTTTRSVNINLILKNKRIIDIIQVSSAILLIYIAYYESVIFSEHQQLQNFLLAIISASVAASLLASEVIIIRN